MKKTAYEKIEHLLKINPNSKELKTALKHFGDDALLRECQRRNIMPKGDEIRFYNDKTLIAEYKEREINLIAQRELRELLDAKDWEGLEEFYHDMT